MTWFNRREARREELEDELRSHLAMSARDHATRGESDSEFAAKREFGNVTKISGDVQDTWRSLRLEQFRQDVRYAIRGLLRSLGFTITVALTFALGVGANGAVFSVIEPLLLRTPTGVPDADRTHRAFHVAGTEAATIFSGAEIIAIRDAVAPDAVVSPRLFTDSVTLVSGDVMLDVRRESSTAAYLPALTGPAILGRYFTVDEGDARAPLPRAVLSHSLWQRTFNGDRSILGREIRIGEGSYTVVGVAAPNFRGIDVVPVDVWTTAPNLARTPQPWYLWDNKKFGSIVMRLAPGVDPRSVEARATIAYRRLASGSLDTLRSIALGSIVEGRGPTASTEVKISSRIAGVAFIVLLVACANVATLVLLRAARRRREIAVRIAMGVSRPRLVRQLFTETMLIALIGGAAAIAVAAWGGTALRTLLMPNVNFPEGVLTPRLFIAVAGLSLLSGMLSGLFPAIQSSKPQLSHSLKEGSRSGSLASSRLRTLLLVGQSALSVVLIVGAALFVRSLTRLNAVDIGIDPGRLIVVGLRPAVRNGAELTAVMEDLASRTRVMPGVESVSLATAGPFIFWNEQDLFVQGADTSIAGGGMKPGVIGADSSFIATLGLRMVRGRPILATDRAGDPPVVVVNEALARTVWPGADPLGRCLIPFDRSNRCYTVVGVTNDFNQWSLVETPRMRFILSREQIPQPHPSASQLYVRVNPDAGDAVGVEIRRIVAELMPTARIMWPMVPIQRRIAPDYWPWQVGAGLFVALGALALIVATIGVYSVLAYTLSQRTHEMGVRIALGARSADVHRIVLVEGLRVVAIGAAAGVLLSLALGRLVSSLLYGVSSRDPVALLSSVVVLLGAGALAGLIPAWRASRVDPVVALRSD